MPDSRQEALRAENVRIHAEMLELNEQTVDGGELDAQDQEKWQRLNDQFRANKAARERLEQLQEAGSYLETPAREAVAEQQTAEAFVDPAARTAEYGEVFERWIRHGKSELNREERAILRAGFQHDEQRALGDNPQTTQTAGTGGNAVPDAAMAPLVQNLLDFGGLRLAPITVQQTANGDPWPVPTVNDTGNVGVLIAENTETVDASATFGQIVFNAYKFSSQFILVPYEFLQDASFDVVGWIGGAVGERLARGLAPYLINGDGVAEPQGLDAAASFVTAAGAAAITRADLLSLKYSVDKAYRQSSAFGFVLKDSTVEAIAALTVGSSDDRPLWVPSMREGQPDRIEGVPYYEVADVSAIGAGNRSVFAGDLSKFWLREAGAIRINRLDERFGEKDQVGFVAFARYDSNIIDAGTDPIKYLRHPAS